MAQIFAELFSHVKRFGRPKLDEFSESIKEAMHALGVATPPEIVRIKAVSLRTYKVNTTNQPVARKLDGGSAEAAAKSNATKKCKKTSYSSVKLRAFVGAWESMNSSATYHRCKTF